MLLAKLVKEEELTLGKEKEWVELRTSFEFLENLELLQLHALRRDDLSFDFNAGKHSSANDSSYPPPVGTTMKLIKEGRSGRVHVTTRRKAERSGRRVEASLLLSVTSMLSPITDIFGILDILLSLNYLHAGMLKPNIETVLNF
ncbi:hypothetical protein N0V90_012827 [Kalmusia sp. IMI 367209]|nr:hypothetical protein N0V90_012827 [Kalmusia sp. IMI 367209]